jgi:hypothetical protein
MGACCGVRRSSNEQIVHDFWSGLQFRSKYNSTEYLVKVKAALADFKNPEKNEIRKEFKSSTLDDKTCQVVFEDIQTWHGRQVFIYCYFLLKRDDKTKENFLELIKEVGLTSLVSGDKVKKSLLYDIFLGYISSISRECIEKVGANKTDMDLKDVYSEENIRGLADKKMPKEDIAVIDFFSNVYPYINNDDAIRDDLMDIYVEKNKKKEQPKETKK